MQGTERAYLWGIDLRDKSVLEIGPASGHLTFWMERQGATVTANWPLNCFDKHPPLTECHWCLSRPPIEAGRQNSLEIKPSDSYQHDYCYSQQC